MNVLQVTPGFHPVIGGVERHVEALTDHLVRRGHRVTVATMEPRGQTVGSGQYGGAEVVRFPSWGIGEAYRLPQGLWAYLRNIRNRFDIVHVHNYHAPLIPMIASAAAMLGFPFVATTHLNDRPHSAFAGLLHYPYALVGATAVRRASAVVCVTEAERRRVIQRLRVQPERTVVIPNGFNAELLEARGADGERDPFLLLSVGRLQPYKRVDAAVRSLAGLERQFRLVIVGDGPQREALSALAAEIGVAGRVTFAGRATDGDLVDWYRRAGVVLSLSSAEAFGMTVLEAVAAGAQVVSSDIPAFLDLARLFPGQVAAIDAARHEQVAAAVRMAADRVGNLPADVSAFTWDAVTDRLLDVYRGVTETARWASGLRGASLGQVEGFEAGSDEVKRKREDGRKIGGATTGAEQGRR